MLHSRVVAKVCDLVEDIQYIELQAGFIPEQEKWYQKRISFLNITPDDVLVFSTFSRKATTLLRKESVQSLAGMGGGTA